MKKSACTPLKATGRTASVCIKPLFTATALYNINYMKTKEFHYEYMARYKPQKNKQHRFYGGNRNRKGQQMQI